MPVVRVLDFGPAVEIRSSMNRVSTEGGSTSGTFAYKATEAEAKRLAEEKAAAEAKAKARADREAAGKRMLEVLPSQNLRYRSGNAAPSQEDDGTYRTGRTDWTGGVR